MFKLYCIYDKVSKELSAPFVSKNDQTARRMWKNDCKKVPAEDLKDYDLVCIGHFKSDFDYNSAALLQNSPLVILHKGVEIVMTGEEIIQDDSSDLEMPLAPVTSFGDKVGEENE